KASASVGSSATAAAPPVVECGTADTGIEGASTAEGSTAGNAFGARDGWAGGSNAGVSVDAMSNGVSSGGSCASGRSMAGSGAGGAGKSHCSVAAEPEPEPAPAAPNQSIAESSGAASATCASPANDTGVGGVGGGV